jgi:hypothetical protein
MSELTKIAAILFKNLSDALLTTSSELKQLDSPPPLSQTEERTNLVSSDTREFTKRENYKVGDRVMVMLSGGILPVKMRISDVLQGYIYIAYFQRNSKSSTREISHDQILGLDPDR